MEPIDYLPQIANPFESVLQGYQAGLGINQVQQQQQQQQAALAQKQQQAQVIQSLVANPNAGGEEYANAMLQVPGMSEQLKQAWDMKSAAAQKQQLSDLAQWGAALQNKQPKIVVDGLNQRADAIENSSNGPTIESKALRAKAQAVQENPEFGNVLIKSMLAVHPQGKAVIDNIVAQNKDVRDQNESDVKVAGDKADVILKNQQITAQKAGALAKVVKSPNQVLAFLQSEGTAGRIASDDLAALKASVPQDPAALPGFLNSLVSLGVKPDDQQKYLTPDANTVANNTTSIRTTSMNNATQIKVQQMIQDAKDDENAFTKNLKKLYPEGSPEYQEALRQWVNKQAGINAAGGGGRSVVYNGRIIASGNEVAQALRNITELPVESNAGFMGMGQPKSSSLLSAGLAGLKNKLNDDQVKTYNTMWTGVSRNLGTLETSGLATTGDLIKSIDKLQFAPGDNGYNALRKLAEVRQITEAALDPKLADPAVPPDQKKYVQGIIDAVHQAVPYTHSDLTRFERMQKANPQLTFQQFAAQTVNKGQPQAAPGAGKVVNFGDLK